MRSIALALAAFLAAASCAKQTPPAQQSLAECCTVTIRALVPEGTGTVYLAGNLPELGPWRPDRLAMAGEGRMRIARVRAQKGTTFEYKFTLGSWDREALDSSGTIMPNSQLFIDGEVEASHQIAAFKKDPKEYFADWKGSGVNGRLVYWTDIVSAHLGPTRHAEIWLPPGYDDDPSTRYPVLYMHDGQNLFDPRIANTGVDWGVDEAVVGLVEIGIIAPVIVVGVWNSAERGAEYSPWHGAPGYARFVIEELMPWVNAEFRTLTGPENTAVAGSSMGGLLSFYLVTRHPDVFGACACMSTHFPLSEAMVAEYFPGVVTAENPDDTPYIIRDIEAGLTVPKGVRYWFDHGTEGLDASYGPTHDAVRTWLLAQGRVEGEDFVVRRYVGADHNETSWRARFRDPLTFLFAGEQPADPGSSDWRDGGVCYEIFVRSFYDSDADGIGDLEGLIQKLDYVNDGDPSSREDLGARCIWLMPINPSPGYHGYDVTDYYRVDPKYGTSEDFRRLIEEAHRRGIWVLVDMVINHVSSQHPYFKHALLYPDSPYRDWFRWSDSPGPDNEYGDNNWRRSPVREEFYYGFFWFTMPDLNWESAAVRDEMKRVATYWLEEMGADGLRLDAIRHLMEDEAGRSANVPRTHDMLREYAAHIREVAPDAFTIGEVFDSTDVLLAYYPDQLDAYFAFEVADGILDAVRTGSSAGLLESVLRLQEAVPANRWSSFLRNHDQPRTLTFLEGDIDRAKLAASLLLTLPGVPFVYYGEEIGMTGDKPDPRIRTPMHWSLGPAAGFTAGAPWEPLHPDSFTANVEAMDEDPNSLLNLYRELIHLRARHPALGSGELVALTAGSEAVAAYVRRKGDRVVLVVANLGTSPLSGVALSSGARVLPAGRYTPKALLGQRPAAPLQIGTDGRVQGYVPLPSLAPLQAYIFDITSEAR